MKKQFLLLIAAYLISIGLTAQNAHWSYTHATCKPTSSVTIVHSNGNAYLFEANNSWLYVSELNPLTMQPLNIDYGAAVSGAFLQGGYEDFNGDIIIYGSVNNIPTVARYKIVPHQITDCRMLQSSFSNDYFIDGCCGYDNSGALVNMLVANYNGAIVCCDWTGATGLNCLSITNLLGHVSDVTWDSSNNCFAACGYQYLSNNETQVFLLGFKYIHNTTFNILSSLAWNLTNQPPFYEYFQAEPRTNLEILNNNEIIVGQCVRDVNGDGIWLSKIQGYNTVFSSILYQFPEPKLSLNDMLFDNNQNLLTLLGNINCCESEINYIAQVDPFSLSGMNAAQITGNVPNTICITPQQNAIYGNDITLQKLELNDQKICPTILATGTYSNSNVYMTETYNIRNSICDIQIIPIEISMNCTNGLISVDTFHANYASAIIQLNTSTNLTFNKECYDNLPCTSKDSSTTKQSSSLLTNDQLPSIQALNDGTFICNQFNGLIDFAIFDMLGRCLSKGSTENGILNSTSLTKGVYIIYAKDQNGYILNQKIFISR